MNIPMPRNVGEVAAIVIFLAVVAVVIYFFVIKKEGFEGMVREFAPFPDVFKPEKVELPKISLEEQKMSVAVEIGNDMVVDAEVKVPAQVVDIPTQTSAIMPKPEVSDVKVESQTVTLPEQVGIVPAVVDKETGAVVGVPVAVPEQQVEIKEQFAYKKTRECFKF
jgi:hypothetical protein